MAKKPPPPEALAPEAILAPDGVDLRPGLEAPSLTRRRRLSWRTESLEALATRSPRRADAFFRALAGAASVGRDFDVIAKTAEGILARAGLPADPWRLRETEPGKWESDVARLERERPESAEDYAARALEQLHFLRAFLAENDARNAARAAFLVGTIAATARLKAAWEPDARGGRRARRQRSLASAGGAVASRAKSERWRRAAAPILDEARRRHPSATAAHLAQILRARLERAPREALAEIPSLRTLRRWIAKATAR